MRRFLVIKQLQLFNDHSYQVDVMKPLLKQMSDRTVTVQVVGLVQDCEPLPILTNFEENSPSYHFPFTTQTFRPVEMKWMDTKTVKKQSNYA